MRAFGSSPLARGLQYLAPAGRRGRGIIPARAGFTRPGRGRGGRRADHPRSRGVYLEWGVNDGEEGGSSPLARGLLGETLLGLEVDGIIPARAGFTTDGDNNDRRATDHPRSRGVYCPPAGMLMTAVGSSPLARGLRVARDHEQARPRIIPARAGFTPGRRPPRRGLWDHPRSRGVYRPRSQLIRTERGSSPLARGLPPLGAGQGRETRIIPARAGFTG